MPRNDSAFSISTLNALTLVATTASTNSTTGALIVPGGVGIAGNLNVAGTITGGAIVYASTSTGTLAVTDTPGTTLTVSSTEECTGVGTGAAIFSGGVYITKNLHIGGTLTAGAITYASTSTGTLAVTTSPGNTVNVTSTEDSTSKTTGSIVTGGGIGAAKAISAASFKAYDTTQSTSITTGSIIAGGGLGAAGNIYAGGSLNAASATVTGSLVNGGFDFILGNADNSTRGSSGQSRALVKIDGILPLSKLVINYAGDFGAGTRIESDLEVTGTTNVAGTAIFNGMTNNGTSLFNGITDNGTSLLTGLTVTGDSIFSGITVDGTSTFNAIIVDGTSTFNAVTINGTSTLSGLTVTGTSTFNGITANGTNTFSAVTVNGNSTFSGVTVNSGFVANSAVTLNAASVANSGFTIAGVVGGSALTIAGTVGFSALTLKFGGVDVFNVTENTTQVNNVNITNVLNVINDIHLNNTPVLTNDSGSLNLSCNNATISGATSADTVVVSTSVDTPVVAINGTNVLYEDTGVLKIGDPATQVVINSSAGIGAFDLTLGFTDQSTRGNSGASRALVKEATSKLVINYANDFTGGVEVQSNLTTSSGKNFVSGGNVTATGYLTGTLLKLNGTTVFDYSGGDYTLGVGGETLHVIGQLEVDNFDLRLGKHDQTTRGDSGESRALVKGPDTRLVVNFDGDFTGGVEVQSYMNVTGNQNVVGSLTASNFETGTATFSSTFIYSNNALFDDGAIVLSPSYTLASSGRYSRMGDNIIITMNVKITSYTRANAISYTKLRHTITNIGDIIPTTPTITNSIPCRAMVHDTIPISVDKNWWVNGIFYYGPGVAEVRLYNRDILSMYRDNTVQDEYYFVDSNIGEEKRIKITIILASSEIE